MACTKQTTRNSMGATANVFDSILKTLEKPDGGEFGKYYSLPALNDPRIDKLPYSIKILLESAIRNCDEFQVKSKDVEKIIDWENTSPKQVEIPFKPARVLLQDFTGVPAVVDLAYMRDAMNKLGGDSNKINPLARAGIDYESSFGKARPNDTILKLQRTTPYYKRNRAHVCSFYVRGECTRGAECPYRHEMPITGELSQQNIKDRYYGNNDPVALKLLNKAGEMPSLMPPDDVSIKTLYVGGLDERVTEQDLRDKFYSHGEIESVRSFGTPEEVDAWLFSDPMRCRGALHFVEKNATVISYGVQTNSTSLKWRGKTEDPTLKFQIPLQIAAECEIARVLIGDPNFSWVVGLKQYAYPAEVTFSPIGTIGPPFFLAIAMFGFIFQIGSLVTEKELKLRQAMSIMGLYDTAYWFSWLTWETLLAFMSSLFTVLFGMIFRFEFFLHNNFAVVFLLFFIFQVNMVGFAFMIATFISKASSATTVGFSMFIVGFLTQIVTITDWPYGADSGSSKNTRFIWSLFPPNLLAKALSLLGDATATPEASGISWRGRVECPSSETDCLMTIDDEDHIFIIYGVMGYYFSDIDADYGFVSETHILRKNLNQEISRYQMETDDVFAQVTLLPENKVPDYCATLKADDWPVCAYISHDCRHMNATEEAHNIATTNRVWEKTLELTGLPSDAVEKNSSMLLIHGYAAGKAALSRDGFWGPIL